MGVIRASWDFPETERKRAPLTLRSMAASKLMQWDETLMRLTRARGEEIKKLRQENRTLREDFKICETYLENRVDELKEKIAELEEKLAYQYNMPYVHQKYMM